MQSEEAGTHMFVHIMHPSLTGSQILKIVNSDTDVVVRNSRYADLNIYALWKAFAKINNF